MTRLVRAAIARSAAVGAVPFALIYLLSPALFPVVFGADWAEAGLIARALVPWLFLNFITSPISMLFVVTARQGLLLWFSVPFTALPLALIWRLHDEIVATMTWLSLSMAGMLAVFLLLALWAARSYDRGAGASR